MLSITCTQVKSTKPQTERSYWLFHFYLPRELNYQSQRLVKRSMPFSDKYMVKTGIIMQILISTQRIRLLSSTMRTSSASICLKVLIPKVPNSKIPSKLLTYSLEHKWSNTKTTERPSKSSCQSSGLLMKKRLRFSYIS